jgi:hypothetical protein
MANHADIGVSQPAASTTTMKVATVTLTRNSTEQHQELLTLADSESTNGLARVVNAVPDSTHFGLVVRVAQPSTGPFVISSVTGPITARSAAADMLVSVYQSTAADLRATVQQISTVWAVQAVVSSVGGEVKIKGNSTASDYIPVRIVDSSGTGFLSPGLEYTDGSTTSTLAGTAIAFNNSSNNTMRLVGSSTPLPTYLGNSTGTPIDVSTSAPSSNAMALNVRSVTPARRSLYSTVVSTASTAFYTLVSSVASIKQVVRGYSVTSTAVSPLLVEFLSGTNTVIWHTEVGSGSSGVTGANLAMDGGIFETAVAAPVNVRFNSTGVEVKISLAYHRES